MALSSRVASMQDAESVYMLLTVMHRECGMAPMNEAKVATTVERLIERGFVGLVHDGQQLVGSVGAGIDQVHWYSDARWVADYWNYVLPQWRGGMAGAMLMRMLRDFAAGIELPLLTGVFGRQVGPDDAARLARKPAFRGAVYVYGG